MRELIYCMEQVKALKSMPGEPTFDYAHLFTVHGCKIRCTSYLVKPLSDSNFQIFLRTPFSLMFYPEGTQ